MDLNSFSCIKKSIMNSDNDKIAGLYNIGSTIGKGHYAVVKEAKHAFTGEKVAIKVIDKTKLDIQSREHLFSEVMCMKLVQHPNVVRLYEVIDTSTKLYLILELGDGGDLYDYIMKFENGLPEIKAKRYFRQIVQAIAYCHNLHVVHRDLKPENVVFFEKVELVKLTDFGFSNKFVPGKTLDTSCGSLAYSAPEILLGDAYDAPKVDIWSLGVILYMLVCGHLPFEEANDSETLSKIMDCKYELPLHLSDSCKNLIKKMLVREPENRSCLEEILLDKWLEYENESNYVLDSFSVPLISQEHLTVEEHVEILTKMSEGNLASVEEIQSILDRNEYSYISATYFLLAERKLKRRYFENYCKMKLLEMEKETILLQSSQEIDEEALVNLSPSALQKQTNISPITETNEDRIRRFSMILEDEEDEAEEEELDAMISLASVREELELTVPKFEVSSQSGISAPFPSRCCSRLSDSIDQETPESELNNNSRFSTFRQQFTTRNRCRSAIYNRRSLIYSSHSLSSIPSFSQLLNNIHEENNSNCRPAPSHAISPQKSSSNKLSIIPRFQRNFSAQFNRRTNSISSDDNFYYLTKHRVSLPSAHVPAIQATGHTSKKRCSYPALFNLSTAAVSCGNSTLSHSHSSSDLSDNELSILRGFSERKFVAVPKSFSNNNNNSSNKHFYSKFVNLKPHTPELMMSNSSIDSDGSFATSTGTAGTLGSGPKLFCSTNRRLRIKSGRSRPSSMGATMGTPFDDFQSIMCGGVSSQIISEEQIPIGGNNTHNNDNDYGNDNASSSQVSNGPLASSPTVASMTMHRDICAPIHEEEELIRSRSYIDKETSLDNVVCGGGGGGFVGGTGRGSYRSVSVDCRRKSESADGTPSKWMPITGGGIINRSFVATSSSTKRQANAPITVPLQSAHKLNSHSLSSQLTQSNFSLSSFASSLRDSKAMMNLVRGAFELQCMANKIKTDSTRSNYYSGNDRYRSDGGVVSASATVSGRESRCEYASVTSLPIGNKSLHSPDDSESLLVGKKNREESLLAAANMKSRAVGVDSKNGGKISGHRHSADHIDYSNNNNSNNTTGKSVTGFTNTNPFIRAGSNMSRKARFILSCCRTS